MGLSNIPRGKIVLPLPEVNNLVEIGSGLLAEFTTRRAINDENVRRLREAAYRRGGVDRRFAAELFYANRQIDNSPHDWVELYLELLSRYFLDYGEGQYALSTEKEALLLSWLGDHGAIELVSERRLVLRVLLRAANAPERLEQRLLGNFSDMLLYRCERWSGGKERSPGRIDAMDIQLIRRLIDRHAGDGAGKLSSAMVAFLLDIDQKATSFADPGGWRRLLVETILKHLLSERPAQADMGDRLDRTLNAALTKLLGLDRETAFETDGSDDEAEGNRKRLCQDILAAARMMS